MSATLNHKTTNENHAIQVQVLNYELCSDYKILRYKIIKLRKEALSQTSLPVHRPRLPSYTRTSPTISSVPSLVQSSHLLGATRACFSSGGQSNQPLSLLPIVPFERKKKRFHGDGRYGRGELNSSVFIVGRIAAGVPQLRRFLRYPESKLLRSRAASHQDDERTDKERGREKEREGESGMPRVESGPRDEISQLSGVFLGRGEAYGACQG